ncbi:MAG: NAD(P)H-dependent oxidoreductase subunit E [Thermodesulfobacteriota bacterium]|nr:NAD(P)H-dependent oxidoreductase subunit E [Thermodesulfobacteriota bacterium]
MSHRDDLDCELETKKVRDIIENWAGEKNLIAILLAVQDELGYLPKHGMIEVSRHLNISESSVYGVATFYNQFRFIPPGKNHIEVCMGTACHVKRGSIVLESWERRLGIKEGEVSEDREFSIERVNCVGCCVMAPVVLINKEVRGKMDPTKVDGFLLQYNLAREAKMKEKEISDTVYRQEKKEKNYGENDQG